MANHLFFMKANPSCTTDFSQRVKMRIAIVCTSVCHHMVGQLCAYSLFTKIQPLRSVLEAGPLKFVLTEFDCNKIAGRCGAPQASYDRRRHRNCFQTGPAQAFPKK